VKPLTRKLLRDLLHLRGQMVAIALVVACGVASIVTMRGMSDSLSASQEAYYRRYRFADVFAHVTRAPRSVADRIRAIPGVAATAPRVVADVMLDVPGLAEPATGRLVSVPVATGDMLNALHIRSGRPLEPGRRGEVLASEPFAEANHLKVGDRLGAVINGRREPLTVVGVALSPEYVYSAPASSIFPDNRRFGILWMSEDVVAPTLDLEGAFNDVTLRLEPGAPEADVIERVDHLLAPYGGLGAHGRADQFSHRFLTDEIAQHRVTGGLVGYIFLGIAAFLLNLVLSRLVGTQRDQVGVLKAFGYSHAAVATHFLLLGFAPVLVGAALGTGLGTWFGRLVADVFGQFYRFPMLEYVSQPSLYVIAFGVSALGAVVGALGAVRRVLALPAAEAMRAEAPPRFGRGLLERLGLGRAFSPPVRMMLRNLERRPLKATLTTFGISLAVAMLVIGRFGLDAVGFMSDAMFRVMQRQDATVVFTEPRPSRVRYDLLHVAGVQRVEPFRAVSVRLRSGYRAYRTAVLGLDSSEGLHRLLDADLRPVSLPSSGVLLTRRLGENLGVVPGDSVTVEVLEGSRPVRRVVVVGLVDELLGLSAYMNRSALDRMLQEGPAVSGAYLSVDGAMADQTYAQLKQTPAVAGVSVRRSVLRSFEETLAGSMNISTTVMIIFACVIAAAMVYNGSRIALSERARDLASLRVIGFSRIEVSRILLAEQALLTLLALPVGWLLGYGLCALMASALSTDLYRFPLIVSTRTYTFAALVVGGAALASALVVRQRVDRLDLVAVLKARE